MADHYDIIIIGSGACSPTLMALAIAVSAGLTAPILASSNGWADKSIWRTDGNRRI